jgi:transcriptional regulator with XRE-family HTH domain
MHSQSNADMSAVFVSQVERGLANPSFDTLLRLAQALGMRLRDLVREV